LEDGKEVLKKKGELARNRAQQLFTAMKMASAHERLFLCISREVEVHDNNNYCVYLLSFDQTR